MYGGGVVIAAAKAAAAAVKAAETAANEQAVRSAKSQAAAEVALLNMFVLIEHPPCLCPFFKERNWFTRCPHCSCGCKDGSCDVCWDGGCDDDGCAMWDCDGAW